LIDAESDAATDDKAWRQLNPAGFEYKRGASGTTDDPTVLLSGSPPQGFVSRYATVAPNEDRAEVFAFMMADPEGLAKRLAQDPVLAAKVRYLQTMLAKYSNETKFWTPIPASDPQLSAGSASAPQIKDPDWPECARKLPQGDRVLRIQNPNAVAVKVGLRSNGAGLDIDVPPTATRSVQVPAGVYEMFFCYQGSVSEVLQGDNVDLSLPGRGVEIRLVAAPGGNYRLRRVRKP